MNKENTIQQIEKEYYEWAIRGDFQNETDLIDIDKIWDYFQKKLQNHASQYKADLTDSLEERAKELIQFLDENIDPMKIDWTGRMNKERELVEKLKEALSLQEVDKGIIGCNHHFITYDQQWKKCEFCGEIRPVLGQ